VVSPGSPGGCGSVLGSALMGFILIGGDLHRYVI